MKSILIICLISFALTIPGFTQESEMPKGILTVVVNGFGSDDGKAMLALANSEKNYLTKGQALMGKITGINNNNATWQIDSLAFGTYAVKVFHDENGNGELDTNFLGIPNEDYGFSNNAPARFGPPGWEDAKFEFQKDSLKITINLD